MRIAIVAALALAALPALADPGFFDAAQAGQDKALRRTQCTAREALVCEIRCAPSTLADGKPKAQACGVSKCRCEAAPDEIGASEPGAAIVIFDAGKLLGLPAPK